MIVKVQASLFTNAAKQQVLIYNKSRSIQWQGDIDPELKKLMKKRTKVFFHAHVKNRQIVIDLEADWQDW